MIDLRERFRTLDAVKVPDLRPAILERPPASVPRPRPLPRLLAAAVAASVAILGIGVGIRAFLEENDAVLPVHPGSARVERVLEVETYPGGMERSGVPGLMIARTVVDQRVWTLSVTPDPENEEGLCFHLNTGLGCGPANTGFGLIGVHADVEYLTPEGSGTTFVYGQVAPSVSEVVVSFRDGSTLRTDPIEGPTRYLVDFYIVGVTGTPAVESVQALDQDGRVLEEVARSGARSSGPG